MRTSVHFVSRLLSAFMALVLLLLSVPPVQAGQSVIVKLNQALGANQRVLDFGVSPGGDRIVYRVARTLPPAQDNPPPPPADLFSVPAAGGLVVQLNPPAGHVAESVERYEFSPDGSEVIYLRTTTDTNLGSVFELLRVPTDGSAAAVTVSGLIPVGARATRDFAFHFAPAAIQVGFGDGSVRTINYTVHHRQVPERIGSVNDGTSNTFFFGEQVNNLIQVPSNGTVRQLNPGLTSGGVVYDFQITLDGTRALYRADQNLDGAIELFSVPADGSDSGFRISGPLVAGGDVLDFKVNAASTRAVYRADATTNGVVELYSTRTNGGIVTKLNAPLTTGGAVTDFAFSPDGSLVVYHADAVVDGRFDLFAVAVAGSAATLLSREAAGQTVQSFAISPDGAGVFFVESSTLGGPLTLFRRPLSLGATSLTQLSGPPVADSNSSLLKFSLDGTRLVYLADSGNDGVFELATVALSEAFTVTPQINGPLTPGGNIYTFQISPDSGRVVYAADGNTPGTVELFSVPIDGGAVEHVSGPLTTGGNVGRGPFDFRFSPDGHTVYYLADAETDAITELYAAFAAPVVSFTQSGYVVAEDGSLAAQLAVARSGNASAPGGVRVQLTGRPDGGTATGGASLSVAGVDFVDNVRDIVFAAGEIAKAFTVAINLDGIAEAAEDFTMTLFEPLQTVLDAEDTVKVIILDTADAPLLDDRSFSLPENSANGTPILSLRDAGKSLAATTVTTYTILAGNTNDAFRIDATGALFVKNSAALDFEANPTFLLVVEARSDNGSSDVASWLVTVLDRNETPLIASQVRSIAENSANGRLVGSRLVAIDPDNDPITFTTTSNVFALSANGQLTVRDSTKLDFETQTQHIFDVTVGDSGGLSKTSSMRVTVLDVTEGDPSAPSIIALTPSSVVAGGKGFKLLVAGKNFTDTSTVRWNGGKRTTVREGDGLIALIAATDISAITTAKIDVIDAKNGKASETMAFAVTKGLVGIADLTIDDGSTVASPVGQTTIFNLGWTHTSAAWRAMNEMDLRLIEGDSIPLWVRYQETSDENGNDISRIILLTADGTPVGSGRFGEARVLENETVRLDLAQASFQGSGETGSNIAVRLAVVFKSAAVQDNPYFIEMYGVDDLGGEQGPNIMGEWRITAASTYLPLLAK